jgi:hypothetical protein
VVVAFLSYPALLSVRLPQAAALCLALELEDLVRVVGYPALGLEGACYSSRQLAECRIEAVTGDFGQMCIALCCLTHVVDCMALYGMLPLR